MPLAKKNDKKFTYRDYVTWPGDERWELIDGEAYNMTPAPSIKHQKIVSNINVILSTHPQKKAECFVGIAPVDVVFSEHDVVQPDILVVCDKDKITEANIQGAPDLIIEVISPGTALKDKREKKKLYERYGVKEYIIVDPVDQYIERFLMEEGGVYSKGEIFGPGEILNLVSLEGIDLPLWKVFEVEEPGQEAESLERRA